MKLHIGQITKEPKAQQLAGGESDQSNLLLLRHYFSFSALSWVFSPLFFLSLEKADLVGGLHPGAPVSEPLRGRAIWDFDAQQMYELMKLSQNGSWKCGEVSGGCCWCC